MRLIFFGRGNVAQPSLQLLQQQPWCSIVRVISSGDFTDLPPADVGVVIDFGYKLPSTVLQHFPHGIINLHPSLLPRWRGPSPIKSALLHDDTMTGISLMLIDAGLDTGPILAQQTVVIGEAETNLELEPRLATIGAQLLIQTLPRYVSGQIKPVPQPDTGVTLSKLIQRADGELTTQLSARELWNRYRAFQPWPGVFFMAAGRRYKITGARWETDRFVCTTIQPEGKRPLSLAEFKRGYPTVSFANIL
ncbi:MAG: hypothetical protein HY565_02920 [Candidatus Kerfeldbacteria bacterium]|nr:hypothetical protein [Candidatus Kerfeldbacteria bacterium]